LARGTAAKRFQAARIKTGWHLPARNHRWGAKVVYRRKQVGLVAGNVTGGGGKPPEKKPIGTPDRKERAGSESGTRVLTGRDEPSDAVGIQKSAAGRVYI